MNSTKEQARRDRDQSDFACRCAMCNRMSIESIITRKQDEFRGRPLRWYDHVREWGALRWERYIMLAGSYLIVAMIASSFVMVVLSRGRLR